MKIALTASDPSIDSQIDERFGRTKYIIIYDSETNGMETLDNSVNVNMAQGAGIQTAGNIAEKKVDLILTGIVGPKAAEALAKAGIKYIENVSGTCRSAIEKHCK